MNNSPYFHTWFPDEPGYKEHTDRRIYSNDHIAAIKEQTNQLKSALQQQTTSYADQTQKLIASNGQIISALGEGFNKIAQINQKGFNQVTWAIEDLHSDMVFCFGTVIQQLEFQNNLLTSILGTLKTPERTKVEELYNEGCLQARGGLLNYAIDYLKESITNKTGHTFFPSHYKLGLLYLIGEGGKTDIVNPKEATNFLLKANELGTALWNANHSFASELATCKLFLSQSYYSQLKGNSNSSELELLNSAIKYCEESVSLNPNLSQGFYHIAKYYSYGVGKFSDYQNAKAKEKVVLNFQKAIEFDRNYLFAVDTRNFFHYDRAFETNKEPILELIIEMTDEKEVDAKFILSEAQKKIAEFQSKNISAYEKLFTEFNEVYRQVKLAERDFQTGTYFGFDDCQIKLNKPTEKLEELEKKLNAEIKAEQEAKRKDEENLNSSIGFGILGSLGGAALGFVLGIILGIVVGIGSCIGGQTDNEQNHNYRITMISTIIICSIIGSLVGFYANRSQK